MYYQYNTKSYEKKFLGRNVAKINAINPPTNVPNIRFFPATNDSDTEACIVEIAPMPTNRGLCKFNI